MSLAIAILIVIVLAVVAVATIGLALKLLWWALIGLVVGALARLVVPGDNDMGLLRTIAYGLVGAFVGGLLADALDVGGILSLGLSVLAAAVLVAIVGGARRSD